VLEKALATCSKKLNTYTSITIYRAIVLLDLREMLRQVFDIIKNPCPERISVYLLDESRKLTLSF
jgi:hypothetical protein